MLPDSKKTHIEKMRVKYSATPLIAPRDVRFILGITTTTLNRMVNDKTLTVLRLGGANNKNRSRRFELENVLDSFKK